MIKEEKQIEQLNKEIREIKVKKEEIREMIKKNKKETKDEKNERKNTSNMLRRMSIKFYKKMDHINNKREENGFDHLSLPEKTELIVRHDGWGEIQKDIICFDKREEGNGGIKNV